MGFGIAACINKKHEHALLCLWLCIFSAADFMFAYANYTSESGIRNRYKEKVNNIKKAERELQKFLIDHPEFKEE